MANAPLVEGDLPCTSCEYNLRSLPCDGVCPECGAAIKRSVMDSPDTPSNYDRLVYFYTYEKWIPLFERSGYPADAFLFIRSAMMLAARMKLESPHADGERRHVSAAELCLAVRDRAIAYFNDRNEAVELLAEWKISSSNDVGRIVYTMVEAGILTVLPDDKIEQFDGLFTLDTLFDGVSTW